MSTLSTGKTVEILIEKSKEAYDHQMTMLPLTSFDAPEAGKLQDAGNVIWCPVQQHAPIIEGEDITGDETEVIEETYPQILGTIKNDFVKQKATDLRTERYWNRRATQSGKRQATELNKQIASALAIQGSIFYRSNAGSGYDFIAEGQAFQNERQLFETQRHFLLNDRDNLKFGKDLAARQTLQGRPDAAWAKGQITENTAGYNAHVGSFLPNLTGGADPATTVTGNQSFAPEAGSVVTSTGIVTNVDYRTADIAVAASASYNVGDKVEFRNTGTAVRALGLADKTDTNNPMTFSIVAKPDGTTITVYPKPIANDDPALTTVEKAYSNINTRILNAATVNRLNIDASAKANLFWDQDSVEVIGGNLPAHLFSELAGFHVVTETMANGLEMYLVFDGDIASLTFRYRIFTWYGITISNPSNCGVGVTF